MLVSILGGEIWRVLGSSCYENDQTVHRKEIYISCPGVGRGLQSGLCEEQPRLPCARHSRFQLAPMAPLQGTAHPAAMMESVCKQG